MASRFILFAFLRRLTLCFHSIAFALTKILQKQLYTVTDLSLLHNEGLCILRHRQTPARSRKWRQLRGGFQTVQKLHRGAGSRMHQTIAGFKEEDSRCRKCDLEEEWSFHILCESDAFTDVKQRILAEAYQDAANNRAQGLVQLCQCAGFLCTAG